MPKPMNKPNKQLLVINSKVYLHPDVLNKLYKGILEQRKTGVILLPSCLEAISVPDDVEIKIIEEKGELTNAN